MTRQKTWFLGSLIVTLFTIFLLISGSSLLTMPLNDSNTIPMGTFITWAGMISLPLCVYWGIKPMRKPSGKFIGILAKTLKAILILAIFWVPISYLLSGNLSFTFTESDTFRGGQMAMKCFWVLNYGIAIGSLAILITYWISLMFKK